MIRVQVPDDGAEPDDVLAWVDTGRAGFGRDTVEVEDHDLERLGDYDDDAPEAQVARLQLALDLEVLRHPAGSLLARELEERLMFWRAEAVARS